MFQRLKALYPLFIANALMAGVLVWKFNTLPPQIPLFYSLPLGEDQLGDTWIIIIVPLTMNIIFILNQFIVKRYFQDNDLIENLSYYLNLFILVSFTLIFIKIIFLVA